MLTTVIPASELTSAELAAWGELQSVDGTYWSPFYRPEFTQAVAATRGNAMVAVARSGRQPVGFLPFEQTARGIGRPIGGPINDYQGTIASPELVWTAEDWLQAAGLRCYRFSNVPHSQAALAPCGSIEAVAPYADLSAGYEAFHRDRCAASSRELPVAAQKLRKAARELGPIEFEYRSTDRAALQAMLNWKLAQCRKHVCYCPFAEPWARPLFDRLLACQGRAFCGVLSTISFGGELAAVLLSLQSGTALHGSVIAYNPALARYSPGMQLLLKVLEAAAGEGITRFDFGKGEDRYKRCLANAAVTLVEGCADNRPLSAAIWRAGIRVREYLRRTSLRPLFSRARMLTMYPRS